MSTTTTARKKAKTNTPKQGTVAAAHQRIAELEAKVRKMKMTPHVCPARVRRLNKYQFTGRVYHDNFGQVLPEGVGYHDYINIRLEDEEVQGDILAPSEEEVMALLRLEAHTKYPDHVRLELADVSTLPAGW